MGIGRRKFLELFGAALVKLAVGFRAAGTLGDKLYVNRLLGIAFTCPAGWRFHSVQELGELRDAVLLSEDPRIDELIRSLADVPFVSLVPAGEANAGIQFYLGGNPNALGWIMPGAVQSAFESLSLPRQIILDDWQTCRGSITKHRVTELPSDFMISGCPAAEYTATFDVTAVANSETTRARARTIAIEHHNRSYVIRLGDSPDRPYDFSAFLSTLKLA